MKITEGKRFPFLIQPQQVFGWIYVVLMLVVRLWSRSELRFNKRLLGASWSLCSAQDAQFVSALLENTLRAHLNNREKAHI